MGKRCKRCVYGTSFGGGCQSSYFCNYLTITGTPRLSILKDEELPGDVCPLFERGARTRMTEKPVVLSKSKQSTAENYARKSNEGATNGGRTVSVDYDAVYKAYAQGLSDSAIARAAGCGSSTVGRWRLAKGFPANNPPKHKK